MNFFSGRPIAWVISALGGVQFCHPKSREMPDAPLIPPFFAAPFRLPYESVRPFRPSSLCHWKLRNFILSQVMYVYLLCTSEDFSAKAICFLQKITLHNGFVSFQVSIVKDDDNAQVNEELEPDGRCDEAPVGKNPSSSSAQTENEASSTEKGAFIGGDHNYCKVEPSPLPTIRVSPRVYGGSDDDDDRANDKHDKDVGGKVDSKEDDIYNFEFSEDQKQAIQELFNLKLDLGFTEG